MNDTKEAIIKKAERYSTYYKTIHVLGTIAALVVGVLLSIQLDTTEQMLLVLLTTVVTTTTSLISDTKVLTFGSLVTTYGIITEYKEVTYKPFMKSITTSPLIEGHEDRVTVGQTVLVEYDRHNKKASCAVGGKLFIICNIIYNISFMIQIVSFVGLLIRYLGGKA